MKLNLSTVGMGLGVLLMVKGAIHIVAAEVFFALVNGITDILLGSNPLVAAERAVEDIFIAHGILSFSMGAMYATAGFFNDVTFFSTAFIAFNVSNIVLHALLINGGFISLGKSIMHLIEVALVTAILAVFALKEKASKKKKE